jgi:putative aminotransferase
MNTDFPRIKRLPPYVFNITGELKMAARRRGEDIIDFSMGNPDGPTPKHIVDKMIEVASRDNTHGYSVSKGIPRLRKAICNWYKGHFDVDLDPDSEAIVTIGSKEGIAHLMLACTDRGDTVLVPNPSYPIHIYGAIIAGADIRSVKMIPGVDFLAELERAIVETVPRPKMMILGFPSNPTAQCVDLEFLAKVVALGKRYGIWVVHDLAYADICFDGYKAPSIMQVPGAKDVAVEFFTMSKSYNMAGWRLGYMVGNKDLVHALARIKSYHDYGTFTPLQVAAIEALEGDQSCVEEVRLKYQKRRDILVKGLNEIGWPVETPKASMYIWAKIPEPYLHLGSVEFSKRLLQDAKVAVSPGIGFGEYGDDHVRIALIENEYRTRQALHGIKQMFRKDGLIAPDAPRREHSK